MALGQEALGFIRGSEEVGQSTGISLLAYSYMNAHDLIKKQHQEVADAYASFKTAADDDRKEDLAKKILTDLTVHAAIEEELYYPALEDAGEEEMVEDFKKDHNEMKLQVAALTVMDEDWKGYDERMAKLMDSVMAHVAVEESDEMPRAEEILSDAKLEELGTKMEARSKELQESTMQRLWAAIPKP